MSDLIIQKVNEVYLKIETSPHIEYELRDRFTFGAPKLKFVYSFVRETERGDSSVQHENQENGVGLLDKIVMPSVINTITHISSKTTSFTDLLSKSMK